jgi:hypothetical protein
MDCSKEAPLIWTLVPSISNINAPYLVKNEVVAIK